MSSELKNSEAMIYREALEQISDLNAERDSDEGWNEWGESDCFRQAQQIAKDALRAARIKCMGESY